MRADAGAGAHRCRPPISAMKDGTMGKETFLGTELRGKTLGIAGLGRIGQEVAQRARAFGMRIVAHDPFISAEIAAGLGVELLTLDELCATADYLTLHLPSTPETQTPLQRRAVSRAASRASASSTRRAAS